MLCNIEPTFSLFASLPFRCICLASSALYTSPRECASEYVLQYLPYWTCYRLLALFITAAASGLLVPDLRREWALPPCHLLNPLPTPRHRPKFVTSFFSFSSFSTRKRTAPHSTAQHIQSVTNRIGVSTAHVLKERHIDYRVAASQLPFQSHVCGSCHSPLL